MTFTIENPTVYAVMNAVRYAVMLSMYGGFTAVIYSVCVIQSAGCCPASSGDFQQNTSSVEQTGYPPSAPRPKRALNG